MTQEMNCLASGGGAVYTQSIDGVINQINSNNSSTINCGFPPKLVVMSDGTQAIYSEIYILSSDGKYDVMVGCDNGGTKYTGVASNNITISGNDVVVTQPTGRGNYGRWAYKIFG